MAIALLGTLDTKGAEIAFVRDRVQALGFETLVIDAGSLDAPAFAPEIARERVFQAAGAKASAVRGKADRGEAVRLAAEGAAGLIKELYDRGEIEAVLALGGSAGTTIGTAAMRALPFGVPKVMVSTLASGQTRPYVQESDIMLIPAVADIAGLNRITRTVLSNACAAVTGMVAARRIENRSAAADAPGRRPLIAATMFGVTTPCVSRAREILEEAGYEVVVFHATGVGGAAMEKLIAEGAGAVAGVLDLTTTELADEVVGGTLSAGPTRLSAAALAGIPQVVSVGALDMVNFGPRASVPERFAGRLFHVHNPNVTLMRTTADECSSIGAMIARNLAACRGPAAVLLPLFGISALDKPGAAFYDPVADSALFDAMERGLARRPEIDIVKLNCHINDRSFAEEAARRLVRFMRANA